MSFDSPESSATLFPGEGTRAPVLRWRMALIVASSAFLSGIAVVLWNRRVLERMRQPAAPTREPMQDAESSEFI